MGLDAPSPMLSHVTCYHMMFYPFNGFNRFNREYAEKIKLSFLNGACTNNPMSINPCYHAHVIKRNYLCCES